MLEALLSISLSHLFLSSAVLCSCKSERSPRVNHGGFDVRPRLCARDGENARWGYLYIGGEDLFCAARVARARSIRAGRGSWGWPLRSGSREFRFFVFDAFWPWRVVAFGICSIEMVKWMESSTSNFCLEKRVVFWESSCIYVLLTVIGFNP